MFAITPLTRFSWNQKNSTSTLPKSVVTSLTGEGINTHSNDATMTSFCSIYANMLAFEATVFMAVIML